jgi:hypothetical protein
MIIIGAMNNVEEEIDKTNTYRSKKERRKRNGLKLKKKRQKRLLNNSKN